MATKKSTKKTDKPKKKSAKSKKKSESPAVSSTPAATPSPDPSAITVEKSGNERYDKILSQNAMYGVYGMRKQLLTSIGINENDLPGLGETKKYGKNSLKQQSEDLYVFVKE